MDEKLIRLSELIHEGRAIHAECLAYQGKGGRGGRAVFNSRVNRQQIDTEITRLLAQDPHGKG